MPSSQPPAAAGLSCGDALRALVGGDVSAFAGLAPACSTLDLAQAFGAASAGPARAALGDAKTTTAFSVYAAPPETRPLRAWVDGERVLLVDLEYPAHAPSADAVAAAWGAPEAKLDFPWNVLTLREGEWVYARRGLTLFVNPDTGKVLRWAAYAPTDLATYRQRLRLQLAERELPLR